ncbi:membrane protein insertase YidC [Novosphingobium sp. Gsoil 351]|uniref:membrane protein insertase YidC n=1 Tax=Novosphingobium sp. Gsoil 351 TaxID=2675225 RepID=UPI0012B4B5F7|nr:membrane protein insertase YidC [Novosphingobium sp. Gsoil 351]QGN54836.1 membrane protein insertase YidC [Novosphingobium sp. Gsoil 351]
MTNQRNLILAVVLTGLLLLGWDAGLRYFYPQPLKPAASAPATNANAPAPVAPGAPAKPTREGGLTSAADIALEKQDLDSALAGGGRVPIAGPRVTGSINLTGAVIDDLSLTSHRAELAKTSGPVRLFSPAGTPAQHFAQFGWVGEGVQFPDARTVWRAEGTRLTPQTPVTLRWDNPTGQSFAIRFAIDADYMITATQTVANRGAAPTVVRPFALVNRTNKTASLDTWNVHSGPLGAFAGSVDFSNNYKDVREAPAGTISPAGHPGWIGFTDIYWMSALIPDASAPASGDFRALGGDIFRADLLYRPVALAPGGQIVRTTRLFAGAKENAVLTAYENAGITNFSLAIDWGWFRWFEKPIFMLLDWLFRTIGNFGVAIICLTFIVRGLMFPVAQRQFASMAAMRAIQPKMKALQERYKDDKATLQQKTMELYKEEKVNPLAGCLPIFLQIPVFFALYKVLTLAIEMRHQPFALWIKDLSAPDPLHIVNLFGLLPFTPPSFLAIGLLALLLGFTMWLQFKLNPAPMDPSQEIVFKIMPWMMMFVMAPFAAGLLIYWITSNILTIAQQWYLYKRHPQLKAQGEKDAQDKARAAARDKPAAAALAKPTPAPRPSTPRPTTPRKPKPRGR